MKHGIIGVKGGRMDPKRERLRQLLKDYYASYYAELRTRLPDNAALPEQIPHFLRDHPRIITVIEYADGYVITHRPSSASKREVVGASETFVIAADDRHRTVGEATGKAYLPHSVFDESEAHFARDVGSGEYAEPTDFELRDYVSNGEVIGRTEEAARREAAEVIRELFEENPPMNPGRTLPRLSDQSARMRLPSPLRRWGSGRFARENMGLLYSLGFVVLLIVGLSVYAGASILEDREDQVQRVAAVEVRDASQKATDLAAATEGAAIHEALEAAAKERAEKEGAQEETAPPRNAEQTAREQASTSASASAVAPSATPPNTTMYLTIPKLGLYDIPVLEGTSEAILSQGVGHVPGTGYPWLAGSNTYIAGHRLGYPGTISDHVFWSLPSLVVGDKVILEDSLGQSYTYQVRDILEVSPADLSVTGTVGSDMVSLQTCIENYGDYWTPGPNWYVRYIVRAQRVA
jgi:sortase A